LAGRSRECEPIAREDDQLPATRGRLGDRREDVHVPKVQELWREPHMVRVDDDGIS
jgi:hypothetical protein